MSVTPSPIGGFAAQFFDNNGVILSGGKIYTYAAGSTTPQATYTSALGITPHSNPIVLDSAGRVPGGEIWLTDGLVYKFVIETATAVLIGTYDNITGVNSNFVNYTVQEEVITATAGQNVLNLSTINYAPGTNSLSVYIDGVNQYVGDSYLETDSNTVTFTAGLHVGAEVKFTTAIQTTTGAVDASIVSYEPPFTGSVATNVEAKLAQTVNILDFGAVGDGVTDDTAAIQAAVDSMTEGGILYFPTGKFRLTDEITIPPVGALILQGSGGNDATFGSPVPSGDGTFIFQEANNKAIFFLGGGCSYTSIKDMTLSSTATPGNSWAGTNKYGIKIEAALPSVIWSLTFSNLIFFNFERGISCVDPNAGSNPVGQDLSVAPVGINQCLFTYCRNGTYVDTNNADYWVYRNCFFFIPSGGTGIYLRRFGMTFIEDCSAGGSAISNNRFVYVEGAGVGSIEKLLIAGCQSESVTNFLVVAATASYTNEFVILIRDSILELGSDIYLGKPVYLITENNRFSSAGIYSDNAGNKFSTSNDFFEGLAEFYFLTGSFSSQFFQTLWGPNPSPAYSNYVFNEGKLVNLIGSTSVPNVTATTLFALPTTAGLYEIYAYLANGGSTYMRSSRVGTDGTNVVLIGGEGGAGMVASVSGANVQVTQNSGITQTINWGYRRIT